MEILNLITLRSDDIVNIRSFVMDDITKEKVTQEAVNAFIELVKEQKASETEVAEALTYWMWYRTNQHKIILMPSQEIESKTFDKCGIKKIALYTVSP